ncbi:transposase family protein [Microcoleus sp. w1-18aA5]|uniref:transposase family protein n=1 Tax=Microcoleus sp. w1-18aA5 TaxID=2818982 RepID=UPI002FD41F4C
MKYEQLQKLTPTDFKRYCGVHQETFKEMVKIVKSEKILQKKSGRPSKLSPEDQILMTLSYLREYPTFFHLGIKWGINESNAYRIVIRTEKALIKSGLFNLPGKKNRKDSGQKNFGDKSW